MYAVVPLQLLYFVHSMCSSLQRAQIHRMSHYHLLSDDSPDQKFCPAIDTFTFSSVWMVLAPLTMGKSVQCNNTVQTMNCVTIALNR